MKTVCFWSASAHAEPVNLRQKQVAETAAAVIQA